MDDDERGTDTTVSLPPPPVRGRKTPHDPVTAAALQRYARQQRRPRLIYAGIVTVVVLLLGVVTVVAWTSGETNNSVLRTITDPPADLPAVTPSADPARDWQTSSRAAIGAPQWRGTVVTFGGHSVQGRDARTGKQTWSYTRSDRTICTAAQLGGTTIAVYRLRGNCDQVAGLDSQTGERTWTRTLDMDGMPVTGTPAFEATTQYASGTLLVRTTSVIYALDPSNGYNRWTYTRYGCDITGATVGTAGALISQTCSNKVVCGSLKFCGVGKQLFLLPNGFNRDDEMKDTNPDHIVWNLIGTGARPVSADSLVSAIAVRTLLHLDAGKGTTVARTPLPAVVSPSTPVSATDAGGTEIVSIGNTTYALRSGTAKPVWSLAGQGPATVVSTSPSETPELATARISLSTAAGAARIAGPTGQVSSVSALPGAPAGGMLYPLGSGYLVSTASGTTAFS